jgi:hypothetical protein
VIALSLRGVALSVSVSVGVVAHAQDVVSPGTRVRLHLGVSTLIIGEISSIAADSISIRPCRQCLPTRFARERIRGVDVSRGMRPSTEVPTASRKGLLLGAAAGLAAAFLAHDYNCHDGPCGVEFVFLPALGGLVGGFAGAAIDMRRMEERWVPSSFPP